MSSGHCYYRLDSNKLSIEVYSLPCFCIIIYAEDIIDVAVKLLAWVEWLILSYCFICYLLFGIVIAL